MSGNAFEKPGQKRVWKNLGKKTYVKKNFYRRNVFKKNLVKKALYTKIHKKA